MVDESVVVARVEVPVVVKLVIDVVAKADVPVTANDPVVVELVVVAFPSRAFVAIRLVIVVVAKVDVPVNVLDPVKLCVVVETKPRAIVDASGSVKVCTVPVLVIVKSVPTVEIEKV